MLARSHALSGALTALAVSPLVHLAPVQTIEVAILTAGAALLPDLDHRDSTIAHALGPVSRLVATGIQGAAGHRRGVHSLLAAVVAGGAVGFAVAAWPLAGQLGAGAIGGLAALGLWHGRHRRGIALLVALLAGGIGARLPATVLAAVVAGGMLVHLAGDSLTCGGVPFFWPLPKRFCLPVVGHTGSAREAVVRWGMVVAVVVLLLPVVRLAVGL